MKIKGHYDIMGQEYQVYEETVKIDRRTVTRLMAKQLTSDQTLNPSPPFPIYEEQITKGLRQGTWKKIDR